jgi:hypothetical protein
MKNLLYNNDGTLSTEAQFFLSYKPDSMSRNEWRKLYKEFRIRLSTEQFKEFAKLKRHVTYYKTNYSKNKEKIKGDLRAYYQANGIACSKRYRERNKEKLKAREAERRRTPKYKLRKAVISAFERIRKNKPTNTLKLLGCSWEEAKTHIESLWQEGMTWENHGVYGWHIDHIRPVSSFEDHELDQMNHISNLQPLWWQDNLSKSDKWN